MLRVIQDLCTLLCIQALRTLVYHPQTEGLVERFNHTQEHDLKGEGPRQKRLGLPSYHTGCLQYEKFPRHLLDSPSQG